MNSFDVVIGGVILLFVAIGALRGLVRELLSLLSWVVAGLIAWFFSSQVSSWFSERLPDATARQILAFMLLFIASFIVFTVAALLLRIFVFKGPLKRSDHFLGALLGVVRGLAVLIIVFALAGLTPFPRESWWQESRTAPYLKSAAIWVITFLPDNVAHQFSYR